MKIALLVVGGVDRSGEQRVIPCLLWHIERLVKAGDEVHVFALRQELRPGRWSLLGATIHNAGNSLPRLLAQLLAEHRRGSFDVSHPMWSSHGAFAALAARLICGVPMLLYFGAGELSAIPDINYGNLRRWRGRAFLRLCAMGASHIAAQSQPMVKRAARLKIKAERLPFGVALDQWPPGPIRRRDFTWPARLLHVGSLNAVKDHATLLAAAAQLKSDGLDFELDVAGTNAFGDDRVQGMIRALGLKDQVRLHGDLPRPQLRRLFDQADLLVVSSRHEAGPIAVLEAGVAGVPVAGTDVGHLSEWNPLAARAVGVGDAQGLAAAIQGLLENEEDRRAVAKEGQRRAMAENADVTSAAFRAVYARLARRAAPG